MIPTRLALILLLLPLAARGADDFASADRILRVRGILQKHCAGCHDGSPKSGRLSVGDHASLLKARPVPAVQPREPAGSQLLTLVEEGSMPPGNRPKLTPAETATLREWITEGAGAYPSRLGDEFAWSVIAEDAARLAPAELPFTRYLTMHHLAGDDVAAVAVMRSGLLERIRRLVRPDDKSLRAVDPTGLVFRLNLRDAGWDATPFVETDSKLMIRPDAKVSANPFDLVLLDYPHGRYPVGTPTGDALATRYLAKSRLIRPVPFVHADWFVHLLTGTSLGADVSTLLKPHLITIPPGLGDKPVPVPPRPAGDDDNKTLVPAIDAWNPTDPPGRATDIPGLEFHLIESKSGRKTTRFKPGEQLKLHIKADVSIYFEVLWTDRSQALNAWSENVTSLLAGKTFQEDFPKDGAISDEEGVERLTLFVSTHEFARGQAWRTKISDPKGVDRFTHPFFLLDMKDGRHSYQPSSVGIQRRTITIEIKK